ncbi:MAG: hypothetical protein VYB86_03050 [Candidatus Thermoplasmatota archaeon]|nr:hypothetical protein [Candidatus Thermoplasmatota archaeon]
MAIEVKTMIGSLSAFIASLAISWYASSLWSGTGDWREISISTSIMLVAGALLWSLGPNPFGFGLIIGSGWYFLNKSVDIILPD